MDDDYFLADTGGPKRCPWCNGHGTEIYEGRVYPCPDCNGSGEVEREDEGEEGGEQ